MPSLDTFMSPPSPIKASGVPSLDSFLAPKPTLSPLQLQDLSAQKYNPTIPAGANDSILSSIGKTLANIPSSAINFVKGAVNMLNPVAISKNLTDIPTQFSALIKESGGVGKALINSAKEIPHTAYEGLVPEATRQIISGDTQGAQRTLENDPVGQVLPYLLMARGVAEKVGKGAEFDNAISQVASPVTKAGSKVASGVGAGASQVLGAETGAGASSVKTALGGGEQFVKAMRGQITPEETVQNLQDAFSTLKQNRATEYQTKLAGIKGQGGSLDVSPIHNEVNTQLKNFNIGAPDVNGKLDFSRSTIRFDKTAQADVQHIYDTMKDFGTTQGDRTPLGIDNVKRAFGDLYSPSSSVRAFTTAVKNSAKDVLNKNVAGYEDMTKGYSTASNLINEIKSATSLGGKANADTVFSKVTSALKNDKEFRLQMLNELENGAGVKLQDALAGHNLSKWIPSGLIGRGIDVSTAYGIISHVFNPTMIPMLLTTSPRVVGEFLNAVGVAKKYVAPILQAVNKLPEISQNINVGKVDKLGMSIQDVSGVSKDLQPLAQEAQKGWKSTQDKGGIPGETPLAIFKNGEARIMDVEGENGVVVIRKDGTYLLNPETKNGLFDNIQKAQIEYAKQSNSLIAEAQKYKSAEELQAAKNVFLKSSSADAFPNLAQKVKDAKSFEEMFSLIQKEGGDVTPQMFASNLGSGFQRELSSLRQTFYRGEGGSDVAQGKALLAEGKHFAADSEYPKRFGAVTEYVAKPDAKIFDAGGMDFPEIRAKLGLDNTSAYISPKNLTAELKKQGYDVLKYDGTYKSTGKPFTHVVEITPNSLIPKSQLTDFYNKVKGKK